MTENLQDMMHDVQQQINQSLRAAVDEMDCPSLLKEAMQYSLLAGGKRIRPIFLMAVIDSLQGDRKVGLQAACALEMVHTYSLIHDDLPSMDDDDYRRGKKTSHKVYGEATAILAGDALLTHAFYMLTSPEQRFLSDATQVKLVRELSLYAGGQGMVGGQMADLQGENRSLSVSDLSYIHEHKTGDLLVCSVRLGGLIAGADERQLQALTTYARHIGLAFQIQDDILDEIGNEHKLGKKVGSDRKRDKTTYVSLYGLEGAQTELDRHVRQAKQAIENVGLERQQLIALADFMIQREH